MKDNGVVRINKESFDSIINQIPDFRLNHAVALELGVPYYMVRIDDIYSDDMSYIVRWEKAAD